jgi:protocatechuate 3,4-dioxygenase beta subunit
LIFKHILNNTSYSIRWALNTKVIILIAISGAYLILINGIRVQALEFETFTLNYAHAQQQTFATKLSGKNEIPPIKTQATGTAKFSVNSNNTLSYEIIANNINAVIGARIGQKNGSLLAEVFNPYAIHNGKSGIPTGQINGVLSSGIITSDDLSGPVAGKMISDLVNLMKEGKTVVDVRTLEHQKGEIRGLISPITAVVHTNATSGGNESKSTALLSSSNLNRSSTSGTKNVTLSGRPPTPLLSQCKTTDPTMQGPEYKPGSPIMQGQNFAKGLSGPRLELTGKVISNFDCKPVKGAVLDVWQADANGNYDNKGYNLRGKIVTDKDGKYVLDTIYPGRLHTKNIDLRISPSPIHIMVGVPGQPLLTTQIYFENQSKDTSTKNSLITRTVVNSNGTKIANFDFVIEDYRGLAPNTNTNIQSTNSTTRIPS